MRTWTCHLGCGVAKRCQRGCGLRPQLQSRSFRPRVVQLVLVSGDTVRAQFCEEDARASSSDVSIKSMSYFQFDRETIVLPVSSLALRVQETTQKRECMEQFP